MRAKVISALSLIMLSGLASAQGQSSQVPTTTQDAGKISSQKKVSTEVIDKDGNKVPGAAAPVPQAGDPIFAAVATPGPQSFKKRLEAYVVVSYGPSAFISPLVPATFRMAFPKDHYPNEWRQGAAGFGRNYGDALVSDVALETGKFTTAALLKEDFRYRPAESSKVAYRAWHAVLFTIVDRSNSGGKRLAIANFAGAFAGAYVGNAYLPDGYANVSHADVRAASAFGGLAGHNLATEFSPEIKAIAKKLHLPFPRLGDSGWWTDGFGKP